MLAFGQTRETSIQLDQLKGIWKSRQADTGTQPSQRRVPEELAIALRMVYSPVGPVALADANFPIRAQKGGFFGPAAEHGLAILFPDTSPRGAGIDGEEPDWDFGTGAGFYLNATSP
ncbi:hypothetical protein CYLTODRAFT_415567, partial [Cylindrobasidium torrendii FP15055 ss-10]